MAVNFKDILEAFDFVSFGEICANQAFLNKKTGTIYWHSDFDDNFEELPEDIDDAEKYIEIPNKRELDLGKNLVLKFTYQYLPDEADEIELIFGRKGAYSKFKAFLERKGVIDQWYEYESQAQEKALKLWCKRNGIEIHD